MQSQVCKHNVFCPEQFTSTFRWLIDLRSCQHDDGYRDGRSQINVHTDERTQVYSTQSSPVGRFRVPVKSQPDMWMLIHRHWWMKWWWMTRVTMTMRSETWTRSRGQIIDRSICTSANRLRWSLEWNWREERAGRGGESVRVTKDWCGDGWRRCIR